ncbi:MAG: M28 family peptidase [Clostridia bacterium]|nr:M28 family peptidase [Clostridia bacterium]
MVFEKAAKNNDEQIKCLADFSATEIASICENIGPRPCGEDGERQAQNYLLGKISEFADEAHRETYEVHPKAFMGFVPVAGSMLIGATAANLVSAFKKKAAAIASVSLVGGALTTVVEEFALYHEFLDRFYPKKTSGNVYAVRKASGETKRRIIISGHTDSAPEWTYTYKLGSHGVVVVAAYALTGLAYTAVTSILSLVMKNRALVKKLALGQTVFLPAYGLLFRFANHDRYVDGANDDLTGTMTAFSVLKYLSDNDVRFENTEVIALLAGGEEAGLRGSKAFFKAHPEYVNDGVETVFVGFDTIRDADYMMIYNKDMTGFVKNSDEVSFLLKECAADMGMDVPIGAIPLGSTDAAAASQAGVKAASFVAMDPAPARYYHTRLDTADILEPGTIAKGIELAIRTVFKFDEKGLN